MIYEVKTRPHILMFQLRSAVILILTMNTCLLLLFLREVNSSGFAFQSMQGLDGHLQYWLAFLSDSGVLTPLFDENACISEVSCLLKRKELSYKFVLKLIFQRGTYE